MCVLYGVGVCVGGGDDRVITSTWINRVCIIYTCRTKLMVIDSFLSCHWFISITRNLKRHILRGV